MMDGDHLCIHRHKIQINQKNQILTRFFRNLFSWPALLLFFFVLRKKMWNSTTLQCGDTGEKFQPLDVRAWSLESKIIPTHMPPPLPPVFLLSSILLPQAGIWVYVWPSSYITQHCSCDRCIFVGFILDIFFVHQTPQTPCFFFFEGGKMVGFYLPLWCL